MTTATRGFESGMRKIVGRFRETPSGIGSQPAEGRNLAGASQCPLDRDANPHS